MPRINPFWIFGAMGIAAAGLLSYDLWQSRKSEAPGSAAGDLPPLESPPAAAPSAGPQLQALPAEPSAAAQVAARSLGWTLPG